MIIAVNMLNERCPSWSEDFYVPLTMLSAIWELEELILALVSNKIFFAEGWKLVFLAVAVQTDSQTMSYNQPHLRNVVFISTAGALVVV